MIATIHGVASSRRKYISSSLDVRVFSIHAGTGSQTQYLNFPTTKTTFDRLFDTGYSNTSLSWTGTLSPSVALNHSNYTTLTSAGVSVPNAGNYFSLEATGVFIPKETGTYTFYIDSDDGSDLYIGGNLVVSYYGGHGIGTSVSGTISLISGRAYTFVARMQEYQGGEGLILKWRRPSQGTQTLQSDEVFRTP
jgi:hypothetical protein